MSIITLFVFFLSIKVRFVKSDDIWLSPNYRQDGCHLTLMTSNLSPTTRQLYFDTVFRTFEGLDFRPRFHYGKVFNITSAQMRAAYPRLDDFLQVRSKIDPDGIFLNDMLVELLGI